jgi:predicted RNA-binding protein
MSNEELIIEKLEAIHQQQAVMIDLLKEIANFPNRVHKIDLFTYEIYREKPEEPEHESEIEASGPVEAN